MTIQPGALDSDLPPNGGSLSEWLRRRFLPWLLIDVDHPPKMVELTPQTRARLLYE